MWGQHLCEGAFAHPSGQALRIEGLPGCYCGRPEAAQQGSALRNTSQPRPPRLEGRAQEVRHRSATSFRRAQEVCGARGAGKQCGAGTDAKTPQDKREPGPSETDVARRTAWRRPSQTVQCLRAVSRPRFLPHARARVFQQVRARARGAGR